MGPTSDRLLALVCVCVWRRNIVIASVLKGLGGKKNKGGERWRKKGLGEMCKKKDAAERTWERKTTNVKWLAVKGKCSLLLFFADEEEEIQGANSISFPLLFMLFPFLLHYNSG